MGVIYFYFIFFIWGREYEYTLAASAAASGVIWLSA